ncbi:MAG TPA: alpha/beta hydrolase [Noviherbaspirillum sp.]|jgi:pimeloyl-ACP methyl ester carboxylesterase|uniref:esterase/lipase family protein n=1 Tax=Noviherbaspirillum sp. TaxID=1926288 RepID=UPI002DDD71B4|nr:alpha/beta hydrolase [Noviherbaspirillum sp.]HEV2611247.1 alpha/beta hydrolase [Noviherbaspirillum sp.]
MPRSSSSFSTTASASSSPSSSSKQSAAENIRSPDWWLLALEGRAPWELGASLLAAPILRSAPKGDGHPVVVFPGLITGDLATMVLRGFLVERSYACYAWEQGLNLGPRPGVIEACIERVEKLRREHGRTVSLVGWSLGGLYAREIAKLIPGDVRQVITLGTPFAGDPKATNACWLYELASGLRIEEDARISTLKDPPPVPTTSIFSRTDGVVAWQCSMERETDRTENIEVHASHMGIGVNPLSLYAIADRLAQPEQHWQRFDRNRYGILGKMLYRDPHRNASN